MADRLTAEQMVAEVDNCRPLAMKLAKRFWYRNPRLPVRDLYEVAVFGLKLAALNFDPSRGTKFITPAYRYAYLELLNYCRVESADGLHVPQNHEPYFAVPPARFEEDWQHPATADEPNELGADFWASVTRDLRDADARVILGVYRDGKKQLDLAAEIGLSKQRVGQLHERAIELLKGRNDLFVLARMVA